MPNRALNSAFLTLAAHLLRSDNQTGWPISQAHEERYPSGSPGPNRISEFKAHVPWTRVAIVHLHLASSDGSCPVQLYSLLRFTFG